MTRIYGPIILIVSLIVLFQAGGGLATEHSRKVWTALDLTEQERKWLKEHPVIRVGGPKLFPPFHWYDESGQAKGIGPEYARVILNRLGLRLEYQPAAPWPEVLDKIKNDQLDLIACAARSAERAAFLNFSTPYLSYPLVIITTRKAPFIGGVDDLHGRKVALVKKISTAEWLKEAGVEVNTVQAETPLACLKAVSDGTAEAAIENLAASSYLIQKHGLYNLKVAAPTSWAAYRLGFAGRKDWPELISVISKALAAMPPQEQTAIRNKWISVKYEFGVSTMAIAKWTAAILIPAALFVGFILFYNRQLRREIGERVKAEQDREQVISKLQEALTNIKQLKGLLPICASCKNIRNDKGYWQRVEEYLKEHSEAEFSHSICPECMEKLYPGIADKVIKTNQL